MANARTLITTVDAPAGNLSPIYQIRVNLDSIGDFTVLTPGGSITYPDSQVLTTGKAEDRFFVVGAIKGEASTGTLTFKTNATEIMTVDLSSFIGKDFISNSFWFCGQAGAPFVVAQSDAVNTEILLLVALGKTFEVC
jgi:hypothetical protein